MADKGLLATFGSYDDLVSHVGCRPTISRVGVLEKISAGKVKRRVIVDSRQSGVSGVTRKPERVALPRLLDVVNNALYQMSLVHSLYYSIGFFVVDFLMRSLTYQIGRAHV